MRTVYISGATTHQAREYIRTLSPILVETDGEESVDETIRRVTKIPKVAKLEVTRIGDKAYIFRYLWAELQVEDGSEIEIVNEGEIDDH